MRCVSLLLLLLGACALPPLSPAQQACLERMDHHANSLKPAFAALGYKPKILLLLDEDLADGRGFAKSTAILGDSSAGGTIRLRPSRLCSDEVLARAVVAHEMAHVALQHRGLPVEGVIASWDKPPGQETEANALAHAALLLSGGDARSARLVACWLGKCDDMQPQGKGNGRL